ncbi:MAG TPA: bifunctional DNA-formamidopyrimidine glycosylase/DNA-(apurinic or apyrimidinic site) lyase [Ignavibacteriaceae bacterium]|nr:bifunctional DNA-formamidopyrimidine glycosylase/DNA-(apurinic or apyrimidinic site) lyase [Ignavibacteriaceae bacterium]
MPELPDVETFRRYFNKTSLNKKIVKAEAVRSRVIKGISPQNLQKKLKGNTFKSTERHGKYLIAATSGNKFLIMHFGMTGSLSYFNDSEGPMKHVHLLLTFQNNYKLAYRDPRTFGAIYFEENKEAFLKRKKLGPDPLKGNYSFSSFKKAAEGKKETLKAFLMDQTILAGIGNIYSDEILFDAGIHPEKPVNKLSKSKSKELFSSMKKVLRDSIKYEADASNFPDDYLLNYRKKNAECPKCGGKIKKITIAGRSSYFCPNHQR